MLSSGEGRRLVLLTKNGTQQSKLFGRKFFAVIYFLPIISLAPTVPPGKDMRFVRKL